MSLSSLILPASKGPALWGSLSHLKRETGTFFYNALPNKP